MVHLRLWKQFMALFSLERYNLWVGYYFISLLYLTKWHLNIPVVSLFHLIFFFTWFHSITVISMCCFVADYVFFENSSSNPYLIRRIEELNKVIMRCFCHLCVFPFHIWRWIAGIPHNYCLSPLFVICVMRVCTFCDEKVLVIQRSVTSFPWFPSRCSYQRTHLSECM